MYQLFRSIGIKKFLLTELPVLLLALFIAELAFKFGSFLLEGLAFLATWGMLGWIASLLQSNQQEEKST
ncbi:MAG TPA: hypothetical protein VFT06_13680 [Flavisolibacter sp.]|nr:hypothetical protein [Flavisolibacter sp.]